MVKFICTATERYGRKVYHGTPINVASMIEIVLMIFRTHESSHQKWGRKRRQFYKQWANETEAKLLCCVGRHDTGDTTKYGEPAWWEILAFLAPKTVFYILFLCSQFWNTLQGTGFWFCFVLFYTFWKRSKALPFSSSDSVISFLKKSQSQRYLERIYRKESTHNKKHNLSLF